MQKLLNEAREQLHLATQNRHRLLITLAGEQAWAEALAEKLLSHLELETLWVSNSPVHRQDCVNQNTSRRWLGREVDSLVFDAHSGFDPNVFSLLCGAVRAGGALILMAPTLNNWKHHPDPVNKRCSVWGADVESSRYLHRLASLTPASSQLLLQQSEDLACNPLKLKTPLALASNEQAGIVENIADKLTTTSSPALDIISGDRGRGKSAALGRLAAELVRRGIRNIVITAPRKAAVDVLMQHAEQHWPTDAPAIDQCVSFAPPDLLALEPQPCDVLFVDEMGAIHLGLLQRLFATYPRIVMAGTVHGYEGAGRGFHTRLRRHIGLCFPHNAWHQLNQPMRWAADDPLESACNTLMLLDAEPDPAPEGDPAFRFLDRDQLAADESLLRQVHGLLASAHYRTRPLDLRQMLDGPNIRIAVAQVGDTIVAACLIAVEGPMTDNDLNKNIVDGKRRPAGHLLPQLLMQRLHLLAAASLHYWRIVRIAVHPARQHQGIGSEFISTLEQQARAEGVDCLGSLFAVDLAVLKFWQRADFQAVALGDNCEATSGSYALTMLKPLNERAAALAVDAAKTWNSQCNGKLAESHPALAVDLREALSAALPPEKETNSGNMIG